MQRVLDPWMKWLLRFVAVYNVLAGLQMLVFYHEAYKAMGVSKPSNSLPLQMVGGMVALFGVGYGMVSRRPLEHRNVLWIGFLSKLGGSLLGLWYVAAGALPWTFLPLLFISDIVYLPPFWLILRRLERVAGEPRPEPRVLAPWQTTALRIGAVFNWAVGAPLLVAYRAFYPLLGLPQPQLHLPVQLLGMLVVLFGCAYWMTANRPLENRGLLALGWWGELFAVALGLYYILPGELSPIFPGLVFLGDFLFLFPFGVILRRLYGDGRTGFPKG